MQSEASIPQRQPSPVQLHVENLSCQPVAQDLKLFDKPLSLVPFNVAGA